MKVRAQIKTQDDIKVNFFVEMTVGEMKDFISDVNINKFHGRAYDLVSKMQSIIREVNTIFEVPEKEGE